MEHLHHRRQSWGIGGFATPRFWAGGCGESQEGREWVVKYYYILSCTGSTFESDDFWREIAVNSQFVPDKSDIFVKLPKKSKFFGNLPWKIEFFFKLPKKIEIFWKFALKNRFFLKLPEKIDIFRKFALKNRFFVKLPKKSKFYWTFLTRTPHISNQIDAAELHIACLTLMDLLLPEMIYYYYRWYWLHGVWRHPTPYYRNLSLQVFAGLSGLQFQMEYTYNFRVLSILNLWQLNNLQCIRKIHAFPLYRTSEIKCCIPKGACAPIWGPLVYSNTIVFEVSKI